MKITEVIRSILILILVLALLWFTYFSISKLMKEETVVSQYYIDDGAQLPSVTICLKWLSDAKWDKYLPDSENWTFQDYKNKQFDIRNVIERAEFVDQIGEKSE